MEFIKNNKEKVFLYSMLGSIVLIVLIMFIFNVAKLEVLGISASFKLVELDSPLICEIAVPLMAVSGAFIPFKKGVLDVHFKDKKDMVKYFAIGAMVLNLVGIIILLSNLFDSLVEAGITYSLAPTCPSYIAVFLSLCQIGALAYLIFVDKELSDKLLSSESK